MTVTVPAGSEMLAHLALGEPEFENRITESLAAAEKRLLDCVSSAPDPRVAALTSHLAAAGGKRLRPLLVLLGAEFGEPFRDGVTEAAVIAELVHISSLYHDDVMDGATMRHGVDSVNARWGERLAVAGGNWLLARAARLASELGPEAVRYNAEIASRLVAGQLGELTGPAPDEDPVAHFFEVTEGKTAALFSMATAIGGLQAGAPDGFVRALAEYGNQLGVAFQISDDLLDLAAPAALTGKEQGKDLVAGVPSLPVLLALEDDSPEGAELRALLADGPVEEDGARRRALELFRSSSAPARARDLLHRRLDLARAALESLPRCPSRRALDALCGYVALRTG
ncbi:polyprenyl synthetase family protein [Streptomyces sp. sk2.1]|uniref:polyprenyl synthetase family protein n=1 Tax=Streptomyces sp. sk2.1 TaxID=2478959 RepID=UPI0011E7FD97|nr:polyprenyl synthetase family protein [Streptomyces sp. sk2.1]TXS67103.1 polyprenyl synthetase family protein [Streptomyces sp. sk2.1]